MTGQKILPEEISSFDYYVNKLPLYLQHSYGFIEHFRIWYNLMTGTSLYCGETVMCSDSTVVSNSSSVAGVMDLLFEMLNIFDLNCTSSHESEYDMNLHYVNFLNSISDSKNGTESDLLDKIGALFGLKRKFSATVSGNLKEFNLNNKDFLILIKCTIIRNYFDGSYAQLAKYYKSVGLPVFIMTTVDNLGDYYNARCRMDLIDVQGSIYEQSQNVKDMFLAGMLTVESMGIQYEYYVHVPTYIAVFDGADAYSKFDSQGVFV